VPYSIPVDSITFSGGQLHATILKAIDRSGSIARLPVTISFLESGTARVTIDEEKRRNGDIELRHNSKARKERYDEAAGLVIVGGLELNKDAELVSKMAEATIVRYGPSKEFEAVIRHDPFRMEFKRNGVTQIQLNDRGLLNVDHWRAKVEHEQKDGEEEIAAGHREDESTWWEETFGGNTDTKPRGPESVALDITFPGYDHVFGIPEHSGSLSLKTTRGGSGNYEEPYRLYNADVFEYIVDSPMTLYGAIPFMQAHKKDSTVGVFWLNAAETWIDVIKETEAHNPLSLGIGSKTDTKTHWISESGLLDLFVFLGPTPSDVTKAYAELTGYTQLPQDFAIAYHQCRWNYVTDDDVRDVDRKMDKFKIPYDVIWLDIEYTDGKKYFTWDSHTFKDPIGMGKQLDEHGRKLVTIIDPHIKNEGGYHIVDELKKKDLAVHNKDGEIYEGWCWPGSSHWIDAFNPLAIKWWTSLFKYDAFKGSLPNTFIWNDMNEPSVFNGPETTMPKDNLHHNNWEHRDLHNLNGMTFHNATYQALLTRSKSEAPRRPFILTRSFFAGSQRLGAMWTGDNEAKWEHLAISFPMILSNGIAGFPFAGADVGGFFGNPEKELLTRWYQAGAFYPFFRGHAHIDTRRREPYLIGSPYTEIITQALRLRYSLLPAWYTAFHEASVNGTPIIRPHYFVYPGDEHGFSIDDQFFVGSTGLLAHPVVTEGASSVEMYLPDNQLYYDYFTYKVYEGQGSHTVPAALDSIPLLMQGGHIIPRKDRPRRSSGLMRWDPYTLVVVLDDMGGAKGELYVDDGESFEYQEGAYIHRAFTYDADSQALQSADFEDSKTRGGKAKQAFKKSMEKVLVERVIVVGAPKSWKGKESVVIVEGGNEKSARMEWHEGKKGEAASWAEVKNPGTNIASDWRIVFA
jgi:alpha 1,3-glucosidase